MYQFSVCEASVIDQDWILVQITIKVNPCEEKHSKKAKRNISSTMRDIICQKLKHSTPLVVQNELVNDYGAFNIPQIPSISAITKLASRERSLTLKDSNPVVACQILNETGHTTGVIKELSLLPKFVMMFWTAAQENIFRVSKRSRIAIDATGGLFASPLDSKGKLLKFSHH